MKSLHLTSPGVLLILAALCSGGIFLLDVCYLQPHVGGQKQAALRELAARAANSGRQALRAEQRVLSVQCSIWAADPQAARALAGSDPARGLGELVRRRSLDEPMRLAWLSDATGRMVAFWAHPKWREGWAENTSIESCIQVITTELASAEADSPACLARFGHRIAIVARHKIDTATGPSAGLLWLAVDLDKSRLQRLGSAGGVDLTLIGTDNVPPGAFADRSVPYALWNTDEKHLAVAWPAHDGAGGDLGCFRADLPAGHIYRQATTARRMVLITLSLSLALLILVIMGMHMLVSGPVLRLLKRLRQFESGRTDPHKLSRNLHGESLALARRLESAFDRLAHLSTTDQLTGLSNRRHFEEMLASFHEQARRYGRPLSLIVMDIDFFKAVNDTGGHQTGDKLLKYVAQTIRRVCRRADLPGRLGGDEFAILLPETDAAAAAATAERIRRSVAAKEHRIGSAGANVTVSVGLTDLAAGDIDSPEAMFSVADQALYDAKAGGRNRVVNASASADATDGGRRVSLLSTKLAGLDHRFKNLFIQAMQEIMDVLESRDPCMADHARKVRRYAVLLAGQMGLPDRAVEHLEIAAMLHDIGMLSMSDDILLCPHELDDGRLETMRRHPVDAARIMEGMDFLEPEIPIVLHHHERFDGAGYPDGLAGSAIPLGARILAVADVFDAMVSPRTFRGAKTRQEALAELRRVAGVQFDPAVVEAFVAVAERLGDEAAEASEPVRAAVTVPALSNS